MTLIPSLTPITKVMPTAKASSVAEPTPTIYVRVSPTAAAKPTTKPTVVAKEPTVTGKPSVSSVKIVENPSTVIINEFTPTQAQTPLTQLDKDASIQN